MADGRGAAPAGVVGRDSELALIDDGLVSAAAGSGGVVLVEGEAGIGKTRLLEAAALDARDRGFYVAVGAAAELEQARPFRPLIEALGISARSDDARRREIAAYLDPLSSTVVAAAATSGRFIVQEQIVDLVDALATRQPLLLVADDLQWADTPTASTLVALCRRAEQLPMLLIAAYRSDPEPLDRFVDAARSAGARHLPLRALDDAAIERLVAEVVGAAPGPHLRQQIDGARGNPFFVLELLRSLGDQRGIDVHDGIADTDITTMPPTLRQTILRRIRALSPTTLGLLRSGAVLGGTFDIDDAAAILGRAPVSLHGDAVAAVGAGLLEEEAHRLRIRHDLIRQAVYEDLPEAIRVSLHREAATVLAERGQPAVVVASHLARSAGGGPGAALTLREAAAELERRDPGAALAMLERALAIDDLAHDERLRIVADQVPSMVALGRLADAQRLARTALGEGPNRETEARLRIGLAQALLAAGDANGAVAQLEAVRSSATLGEVQRAQVLADTAWARLDVYDLDASERDARAAADWARQHSDRVVLSSALAIQSRLAAYGADFERAVQLGRDAVDSAGNDPESVPRTPHLYLGLALVNADRSDEALTVLREGRRLAEQVGVPWAIASYHNALILHGFHCGAWDDATAEAEAGRSLHLEAGTRAGYLQTESMLGLMWMHRADYELARDALARAEADFREPGHDAGGIVWLLWLQAASAELDGDLGEATRLLGIAFDLAEQLNVHSVKLWYGPDLVRCALGVSDRERAVYVCASVSDAAERAATATARGASAWCEGLVAGDAERLLDAAGQYERTPRRFDHARVSEAAGTELAHQNQRDGAVEALKHALDCYEDLGAAHHTRRVLATLRELGVRKGVRGERQRPLTGPESLTPTERAVLDLVGAGLRNSEIADRLFVSRRTVETHVGRLYAKLQVRGRVALAQVATAPSVRAAAADR